MAEVKSEIFRRFMYCVAAVVVFYFVLVYPTMPSQEMVIRVALKNKAKQIHYMIEGYVKKHGDYPSGKILVDGAQVTWRAAVGRFAYRIPLLVREHGDNQKGDSSDEETPPEEFVFSRTGPLTPFYLIRANDGPADTPIHYIADQDGHPVIAAIPSYLSEWTTVPDISMAELLERSQRGERVYVSYADRRFFQVNAKTR